MKNVEVMVTDDRGFATQEVRWQLTKNDKQLVLVIDEREYYFNDEGELFLNKKKLEVWKVCYSNPLVGYKGEALYFTCRARSNTHAIRQAMHCNEFVDKIYMKHFDKKYLKAWKAGKDYKTTEINSVQYYEGDPRL